MVFNRQTVCAAAEKVADRLLDWDNTRAVAMEIPGGVREGVIRRDFGISVWDWPQGVGLLGLINLCQLKSYPRYEGFLESWFAARLQEGLPARNINTTAPLLALIKCPSLAEQERYTLLLTDWADWLCIKAPKTRWGGLQHVITSFEDDQAVQLNEGELWIDTLFMAVLFLHQAGRTWGRADWCEQAMEQALAHTQYLYDKQTGLFHHGWSFKRNDNFGQVFWLRGNSWYTLAMSYWLKGNADLPVHMETHLGNLLRAQGEALLPLQSADGLWHTVLDDPASYAETSGSAAIAAGWLRLIKNGVLPETFLQPALNCVKAVMTRVAADGTVQGVSAGTVVGENAGHYKNIIQGPMAYGQSLTLLAFVEALEWLC